MYRLFKTNHKWPPEEVQEVISYYKNTDYTTKEIAELFDTTPSNLRRVLNQRGFRIYELKGMSKKAKQNEPNPKKEERAELEQKVIAALRASTSRKTEVAKTFGLTVCQVNYILLKHKMNLTCLRKGYYDKE